MGQVAPFHGPSCPLGPRMAPRDPRARVALHTAGSLHFSCVRLELSAWSDRPSSCLHPAPLPHCSFLPHFPPSAPLPPPIRPFTLPPPAPPSHSKQVQQACDVPRLQQGGGHTLPLEGRRARQRLRSEQAGTAITLSALGEGCTWQQCLRGS